MSRLIELETPCRLPLTPALGPSSITTSSDSSGPSQCPELMLSLRIQLDPDMPLFLLALTPHLPVKIRALSCSKHSLCLPEKLVHSRKALNSVLSHITCLLQGQSPCFSQKRRHIPLQGPEVLTHKQLRPLPSAEEPASGPLPLARLCTCSS